jgi:hypothetical protein
MNFKTFTLSLGWFLFFVCISIIAAALFSPRVADGILWRFENYERVPNLTQRSLEDRMFRYFLWIENFREPNQSIFFGDSHLQMIPPNSTMWASNFAVGGQPISRMIDRAPKFKSLSEAPTIFLNGGENDLAAGVSVELVATYWKELLERLPKTKRLICVGLPESSGERQRAIQAKKLNEQISKLCSAKGAQFLPLKMGEGAFVGQYLSGDAVHLSAPAMLQLAKVMQKMAEQP